MERASAAAVGLLPTVDWRQWTASSGRVMKSDWTAAKGSTVYAAVVVQADGGATLVEMEVLAEILVAADYRGRAVAGAAAGCSTT